MWFSSRKSKQIESVKQQAWSAFQAEDYRCAKDGFERWRVLEPQSATAWFGAGYCSMLSLHENGEQNEILAACVQKFERAISLHESSKELSPNQLAAAHLSIGFALNLRGQSGATEHFRAAIEAAPESPHSLEARNELAAQAVKEGNLATAERLLSVALRIDPSFAKASENLKAIRREQESFDILLDIMIPLPQRQVVVRVHPDETLGEIATRVLPGYGLTGKEGFFFHSGDDALPSFLDSGRRELYQTVRELGIKERDTVHYMGIAQAPGADDASWRIRSIQLHRGAGRMALARREIRDALQAAERDVLRGKLDEAQALVNALSHVDAENAQVQRLRTQVSDALRERAQGSAAADGKNWLHSHGDPTRTSQTVAGPLPSQPVWEFGAEDAPFSPPIVAHGQVYVASWNHTLYCVDEETGQERWQWTARTILDQPPSATDTYVYITDRESLYCLDAQFGQLRWCYDVEKACSPVADNDKVYIIDRKGNLRCLMADSGQEIAWFATDVEDVHVFALKDDWIVAVSNQAVFCLDIHLHRVLWKCKGRFDEAVPVLAYGNVYITTFAEGLWCLDIHSGLCRWIFFVEARIRAAPAVGHGRVCFGDTAGHFGCLDAMTGELLWAPVAWMANCLACSVAPAIASSFVYVLLGDGVLSCLDLLSGAEIWRGTAQQWQNGVGSLAVTAQAIYYSTSGGRLYCIGNADLASRTQTQFSATRPPERTNVPPLRDTSAPGTTFQLQDFGRPSSLSQKDMDDLHSAVFYLIDNLYDEAVAILQRLERKYPNEEIVLQNLAVAYESQGLVGDALASYDHILEVNPGNMRTFNDMGRVLRTRPDLVAEIYGQSKPIYRPPILQVPYRPQQGLAIAMIEQEACLLCQPVTTVANNLIPSLMWYWWLLIETPSYPVLNLYWEFEYQPYREYHLQLPLDVANPQTKVWLEQLMKQQTITIHLYGEADRYLSSRSLSFPLEQSTRLRSLYQRTERILATLPVTVRDFQSAVKEVALD